MGVVLIKTNESIVEIPNTQSLADLQKLVGGYIELIYANNKVYIVNEEGLLKGLSFNRVVSYVLNREIVGDVVVFDKNDWLDR